MTSDSRFFTEIFKFAEKTALFCSEIQFYFAILGMLLNTLHLITLSQKSMRTNSINILLIGIAISDLIFLFFYVHGHVLELLSSGVAEECTPPNTWFQVLRYWILMWTRDIVRRVSIWLGVIMALIRSVVMKYSTNQRVRVLIRPSTSWLIFLSVTLISSLISSLQWGRMQISRFSNWQPPELCLNYPLNTSLSHYELTQNSYLEAYHYQITEAFLIIDGFLKLAPPIFYPFLAGILIFELKRARKFREELIRDNSDKESDNTTKVVIWMTFSYFLAEAPIGISYFLLSEYLGTDNSDILVLINNITIFFITILMLHCSFHCFICFLLNSQYRKAIKRVFGCYDSRVINSNNLSVTF